ncbi:unnamed protein product [Linum tenue]|uniref:F-box domain-containing protein n=1 Tax=Linum tenue TaxID=586396 RepID=A0AAV0QHK7_9ROSI|nr:unnamed protein product [Linum tenue]
MDPRIWNSLPEDILYRILSVASLQTLLLLRSTCKRFNSLFLSPAFISSYKSSQPSPSFLLLSHPHFGRNRFAVYDTLRRRWRNRALPISTFLPRSLASSTLLASSKGILCFSCPASPVSFLICNFSTKSTRIVKFPNHPFPIDSLTLVVPTHSSGGYKIFALCPGISFRQGFVYDSASRRWHQFDDITPNIKTNTRQEGVIHGDSLYFYTVEPYSIVGYDLEQRRWNRALSVGELIGGGSRVSFVRLVGDAGEQKMYLIGGIATGYGTVSEVKVWELDDAGRKWVEQGSMPAEMCRKFAAVCYHNYQHLYCLWHGGMICLCCNTWPEVLWFDVGAREWGWLPKCPLLPEKGNFGFTWFSVVPDLNTLV